MYGGGCVRFPSLLRNEARNLAYREIQMVEDLRSVGILKGREENKGGKSSKLQCPHPRHPEIPTSPQAPPWSSLATSFGHLASSRTYCTHAHAHTRARNARTQALSLDYLSAAYRTIGEHTHDYTHTYYIHNLHTCLHSETHRWNRDWRVPHSRNDVHAIHSISDVDAHSLAHRPTTRITACLAGQTGLTD